MKTNVRKSNYRKVAIEKKTQFIEVMEVAIDDDTFFNKTGIPIDEATADTVNKFISAVGNSDGHSFINELKSKTVTLNLDFLP